MLVDYDREKLEGALVDFSNATGININFVSADMAHSTFHTVEHNCYCRAVQMSAEGAGRCFGSDRELMLKCAESRHHEMHICHAGLVDVAVPILHANMLLGYIILGQMKINNDFSQVRSSLVDLSCDVSELEGHYAALPLCSEAKIAGVANVAVMLTKHILLENMLSPRFDKKLERAMEYIDANLSRHLSVYSIAAETNISKTSLYRIFRENLNCTLNDYINAKRVERSIQLLLTTDMSVEDISGCVGFSSGAYYTKIFKKHNKLSPLQFRKEHAAKRG